MPTSTLARGPVQAAERSPAPDLARGLMLLLIALANTPFYLWGEPSGRAFSAHPVDGTLADKVAAFLVIVLADQRTYPVFAFLFGYGMVQLYTRQTASGTSPQEARRLLQKRNLLLLGFGFVHAALLWHGDVLGAYGMAGLLMVWLFFQVRDRTLIVWTWVLGLLLLLGTASAVVGAYFLAQIPVDDPIARAVAADLSQPVTSTTTSYLASVGERLALWSLGTLAQTVFLVVVPMAMLLAFWAGRRRILEHPGEHLPLLRRTAVVGLAIGWLGPLPSALDHAGLIGVPDHAAFVFLPVQVLTGLFGALGYVALFGLIGHHIARRRVARLRVARLSGGAASGNLIATDGLVAGGIQAVGKRSLTSYLLQSLLCAPVLAAWGLGLGQHLSSWSMLLYGVAVWAATVLFAVWQERTGRSGPAETALRRLLYGRSARRESTAVRGERRK